MTAYKLTFSSKAIKDIAFIKKTEKQAYIKREKLLGELKERPYTGTGKPEQLKYAQKGKWSRRITQKHRLLYEVSDQEITVYIESAIGHYGDK